MYVVAYYIRSIYDKMKYPLQRSYFKEFASIADTTNAPQLTVRHSNKANEAVYDTITRQLFTKNIEKYSCTER